MLLPITTIITIMQRSLLPLLSAVAMESLLHCYVLAFLLLPVITAVMDPLLPINQMRNR